MFAGEGCRPSQLIAIAARAEIHERVAVLDFCFRKNDSKAL
jgi:hypothetical protein